MFNVFRLKHPFEASYKRFECSLLTLFLYRFWSPQDTLYLELRSGRNYSKECWIRLPPRYMHLEYLCRTRRLRIFLIGLGQRDLLRQTCCFELEGSAG
jgi:hypothetical protein